MHGLAGGRSHFAVPVSSCYFVGGDAGGKGLGGNG
jgi:hypothetical protein